jgi:hypothetical protein
LIQTINERLALILMSLVLDSFCLPGGGYSRPLRLGWRWIGFVISHETSADRSEHDPKEKLWFD